MRVLYIALFACVMPVSGAVFAQDTGAREYPADSNAACMDRGTSSAGGGCIANEDGTPRDRPPVALPSEPDTTRQSPPASEATPRSELPMTPGESR